MVVFAVLAFVMLCPSYVLSTSPSQFTFFARGTIEAKEYLGLSGYPTSTSEIDAVIDVMKSNGFNVYRMSFNPKWISGPHPYHVEYIQYFLSHSGSNISLIVDRNHLFPATEDSAKTARNNWATVKSSIFETLAAFPNNSRLMVELINEYVSSDFYSRMQTLDNDIRDAGYTNPIVVNKYAQDWAVINDSGIIFQGYHYYMNTWNPSGAISNVKIALSKGIKLLNTEVGADSNEADNFTSQTVAELTTFLAQSALLGVGNCIWMHENLDNWQKYQSLHLITRAPAGMRNGVNYLSNGNMYSDLTDAELDTDFAFFAAHGISTICARLTWGSVDTDSIPGAPYSITAVNNIKRLLVKAEAHGLTVVLTVFHTHFQTNANADWHPPYVGAGNLQNIFTNATWRTAYIDAVQWVIRQLQTSDSYDAIEGIFTLNEPFWGSTSGQPVCETWIQALYNAVKTVDANMPCSVRFACPTSPWSSSTPTTAYFNINNLRNYLDFYAINQYTDLVTGESRYSGHTVARFRNFLNSATTDGKQKWVAEWGVDIPYKTVEGQRLWYEHDVDYFNSQGIYTSLAWAWQSEGTEAFNIATGHASAQSAFYEL